MVVQDRKCAVTGASGYLGSKIDKALSGRGWIVHKLVHRAKGEGDQLLVPFTLDNGTPEGFFKDHEIDTLIHCAYDFRPSKWSEIYQINVRGSVRLMEAAQAENVTKIIFISSVSAFEGCKSLYGKAKLEIEKEALRLGAVVIRPGLIYGDQPGAMMGALARAVKLSPIVPIIGNGKQLLYLVHEDDLVSLISKLCTTNEGNTGAPIIAAAANGKTLSEILIALARRQQKRIRLVPLPWRLCWGLLKALEVCGLRPGFRSDSIVSLVNTDPDLKVRLTRQTGIQFREFPVKS
jgi:nucleoside-diphosphate-sugar epimerase